MAKTEVHNAIVTRNTDDDIGVALRGAVFFEAPSLFEGEYPLPAYPCFPFASSLGAGFFLVPKIGDEIEVLILVDDPSQPYDTTDLELAEPRYRCMIYSDANDIAEEFKVNYPFRMGWKSNSGHLFMFDDFEGEQLVKLAHTVGTLLQMERNGDYQETVQKDKLVDIFGSKITEIQKTKEETVGGDSKTNISKNKEEDITGNETRTVGGDQEETVTGNRTFTVNELIETIGLITRIVSGSVDEKIDGGRKAIIGGSDTRAVVSNDNHTVSGQQNILVAQEHAATYGVGSTETIATLHKTFEILAGNFLANVAAGNIDLNTLAGTVNLANALAAFAIDVAGGVVAGNNIGDLQVDPAGNVLINGITVTVNSGVGQVLTNVTAPVVDNITGAPHIGVPTFFA